MTTPQTRRTPAGHFLAAGLLLWGCAGPTVAGDPVDPAAERARRVVRADTAVSPFLTRLLDEERLKALRVQDFRETSLKDVITLTTPEGYRLKYRFLEIGVPVAQALSLSGDPQIQSRVVEAARWVGGVRSRAQGLLLLASRRNPEDGRYFREALLDKNVAIQFAAVEALAAWDRPEAVAALLDAAHRGWSPLIRLYAAQAAFRRGAAEGRQKLLNALSDPDWFARALAARYLGDLGSASDAETVIARIAPEHGNPYTQAELCIAGLKLLAKRSPAPVRPPAPRPSYKPRPQAVGEIYELEPLTITAPRVKISGQQLVDVRIDNELVALLERIASTPPPEEEVVDPHLSDVNQLVTPEGFGLKIRYSDIGFLLTEGLAGTTNRTLINRLETIARQSPNTRSRASALVALGHDTTRGDEEIFNQALRDPSVLVRFGAAEALAAQTNPMARPILAGAAQTDPSAVVRLFAAQALARAGDPQGVELLRRGVADPDWVSRAIATLSLGQMGDESDFERLLVNLNSESEDRVAAELCLAALRLSRL